MRNSSQNAGCMRRSPASHCCHVRQVVCTSAPAAVCDSRAASRAARICSGCGLAVWMVCKLNFTAIGQGIMKFLYQIGAHFGIVVIAWDGCVHTIFYTPAFNRPPSRPEISTIRWLTGTIIKLDFVDAQIFEFDRHFLLLPLLPRGAVEKQCASHELNYTRNVRKCKNFFEIFFAGAWRDGQDL